MTDASIGSAVSGTFFINLIIKHGNIYILRFFHGQCHALEKV
jgi:hypothetical protein